MQEAPKEPQLTARGSSARRRSQRLPPPRGAAAAACRTTLKQTDPLEPDREKRPRSPAPGAFGGRHLSRLSHFSTGSSPDGLNSRSSLRSAPQNDFGNRCAYGIPSSSGKVWAIPFVMPTQMGNREPEALRRASARATLPRAPGREPRLSVTAPGERGRGRRARRRTDPEQTPPRPADLRERSGDPRPRTLTWAPTKASAAAAARARRRGRTGPALSAAAPAGLMARRQPAGAPRRAAASAERSPRRSADRRRAGTCSGGGRRRRRRREPERSGGQSCGAGRAPPPGCAGMRHCALGPPLRAPTAAVRRPAALRPQPTPGPLGAAMAGCGIRAPSRGGAQRRPGAAAGERLRPPPSIVCGGAGSGPALPCPAPLRAAPGAAGPRPARVTSPPAPGWALPAPTSRAPALRLSSLRRRPEADVRS